MKRQFLYHFPYSIVWIAVSGMNVWAVYSHEPYTSPLIILQYGVGTGMLWSLEEYVFHRYALHYPMLYSLYHGIHHVRWVQLSTLFKPQWLIAAAMASQYQLLVWLFGTLAANHAFVWLPMYYLLFEWLHYCSHYSGPRWLSAIREYHRRHHIDETVNYGITTPLWDWVGGTLHADCTFSAKDVCIGLVPLLWFYSCSTSRQNEKSKPLR
jgi:sterol desaturase/sphingolipid hydroxylase (fatty acid hydroxylase superfamily)